MKKIGKYLSITFLLLLGLCCAGVLYLFFVPGSNLFNITYISYNETKTTESISADTVSKVVVNSYNYPVNIVAAKTNTVAVRIHNNSFGFAMKKDNYAEVTYTLKEGVLTFNCKEPVGFAINNSSAITLYMPCEKFVDLELDNNASLTKIKNENVKIKNLTYTSNNGDIIIEKGKISGELVLDLHMADFNIKTEAETNSNNVELSLTTGKFNAEDEKFNIIDIKNNKRGVVIIDQCDQITMNNNLSGGRIEATKVANINIRTSDTHVNIKEVTAGATIDLTKYGSVNIDSLTGISRITTNTANITINKTYSNVKLKSTHGDIKVKNAYLRVDATTTYGNINVNFAEDAGNFSTTTYARSLYAQTKNGRIIASGVDNVNLTIDDDGSGSAFVTFNVVSDSNEFNSDNGSITIIVNKDDAFNLDSKTVSGYVRINLTQTPVYNGWVDKEIAESINCTDSENLIKISTISGNILMLDSNFY